MPPTSGVAEYLSCLDRWWVPSILGTAVENRHPANTDDLIGTFQQSTGAAAAAALAAVRGYEGLLQRASIDVEEI